MLVLMNRIVFVTHRYGLSLCGIPGEAMTRECPARAEFLRRYHEAAGYPDYDDSILKGVFPTESLYAVALHEGVISKEENDRLLYMREYALSYLNVNGSNNIGYNIQLLSLSTLVEWESIINTIGIKL